MYHWNLSCFHLVFAKHFIILIVFAILVINWWSEHGRIFEPKLELNELEFDSELDEPISIWIFSSIILSSELEFDSKLVRVELEPEVLGLTRLK